MDIRKAILDAADSIERNPRSFDFMSTKLPDPECGTPGCALGWIGMHLQKQGKKFSSRVIVAATASTLGLEHSMDFYERMRTVETEKNNWSWKNNADDCARTLRLYADKYYPVHQGIPDQIRALFERADHDHA